MADDVLQRSCLCKSVRYKLRPPFLRFNHCYCSRCRKATGAVRATNLAVPINQFRLTTGEELILRYDLPEARSFTTAICTRPVPHASRNGEHMVVPSGTLNSEPGSRPTVRRNWGSRVSWVVLDESHLPCEG